MAMAEEQKTKQVIEIITHPEGGRMELEKMANSMLAIKRDYHRWLDEQELSPKDDPSLKLYVEKVEEGSIKLWLAKFMESGIPLGKYGLNFFQKIEAPEKSAAQWSREELKNKHHYLRCNRGNNIVINLINVVGDVKIIIGTIKLPPELIEKSIAFIKDFMAAEEKHRNETPISFAKYGTDGKANIIAHDIDENKDYAAKLLTPAITFLGLEKENPFNKIYIANVTARVSAGSKKVLSYIVKDITDSQPPAPLSGVPVSTKNEAL